MECIHCKGKLQRGTAPFNVERQGYHIHWSGIPAWVCTQCGESYFESEEVNSIQKALQILESETAALLAVDVT
jgi:YgiT-type zinc finger domain-containing protein